MAIYHAQVKTFSRALGHSAVAAAAYRVGGKLVDERTGLTHDYSIRTGVAFFETLLPADAPQGLAEVVALWNAAEAAERRVDARVARELIVALPMELDDAQRRTLAINLGQMLVDRYRVALTLAVHTPDAMGDDRNHHVHLLFSTRALGPMGFGAKTRVLDDKKSGPEEVRAIREAVALLTNQALQHAGSQARVDHRSLDAQAEDAAKGGDLAAVLRLSRTPTKHEGKAATAGKRRGRRMDRVVANEVRRGEIAEVGTSRLAQPVAEALGESRAQAIASEVRSVAPDETTAPGVGVTSALRPTQRSRRSRVHAFSAGRKLGPIGFEQSARHQGTAHAVYVRALQQAAREAGVIAAAYIERLKLEAADAVQVLRRATDDAAFALLLQRSIECSDAVHATKSDGSARGKPPRLRAIKAREENVRRRAAAFERYRMRLQPLHSDKVRTEVSAGRAAGHIRTHSPNQVIRRRRESRSPPPSRQARQGRCHRPLVRALVAALTRRLIKLGTSIDVALGSSHCPDDAREFLDSLED